MKNAPQTSKKTIGPGCIGAAVGGAFYVVFIWVYLGRHAWDFDIMFSFEMMIATLIALGIGAISGGLIAKIFTYLRARNFRLHLSSLLACVLALGAFMALSTKANLGKSTAYGPSRFYGWPLPAVGINYVEEIPHEVKPWGRTYYSWGLWGPGFVLDVTVLLLSMGGLAIALEHMTERRKRTQRR